MARKLKFGSPAWRKKYLKSKKRNAPKRKRAKRNAPRKRVARRGGRPGAKRVRRRRPVSHNPPKLKRLTRSTGWVKARGVKIVKKGGRTQILIRK